MCHMRRSGEEIDEGSQNLLSKKLYEKRQLSKVTYSKHWFGECSGG